jgi:hypothetical protein
MWIEPVLGCFDPYSRRTGPRYLDVTVQQIVIYVFLGALWFVVYRLASHDSFDKNPPMVNRWFPFLGYLIVLIPWAKKMIAIGQYWLGDIFSLKIAGKTIHVILDPMCGTHIFREHRTFSFFKIMDQGEMVMFGIPEHQATDTDRRKATMASSYRNLLSQKSVDQLIQKFNLRLGPILSKKLKEIDVEGKLNGAGVVLAMKRLITSMLVECTSKTFFGDSWQHDEGLIHDSTLYDIYKPMMIKGYPQIFQREGLLARERLFRRMVHLLQDPLVEPSAYAARLLEVVKEYQ